MAATWPTTIVIAVGGRLERSDLPALCGHVRGLLAASGAEVVLCDLGGLAGADLVVLDALARLQLTALRLGGRVRLCRPSAELRALLELTGLAGACGLCGELERDPEQREDALGVEEERELDDPAA